jgi:hypothetical protein
LPDETKTTVKSNVIIKPWSLAIPGILSPHSEKIVLLSRPALDFPEVQFSES